MSQFLSRFVIIRAAPICKNNESDSANNFKRWLTGICIFHILPVKISPFGYTLVYDFFLEQHLYMIFSKVIGKGHPRLSKITVDQARPNSSYALNILGTFESYLGLFNNYVTLKFGIWNQSQWNIKRLQQTEQKEEKKKTSKFQWALDNIRIEKIISTRFRPQKVFFDVSAVRDIRHCAKLQSCAISRKVNDATLRKWQKRQLRTQFWVLKIFSMGFTSINS